MTSSRQPLSGLAWRVLAAVKATAGTLSAPQLQEALRLDGNSFVRALVTLQQRGLIRPVRTGLRITRDGARALSSRFAQ